jgi:F-type H+-transporting ATPase subunit delta
MLDARHPAIPGFNPLTEASSVASAGTTVSHGGLADRYATALYALADEQHALDQVVDEMAALGRLIDASPEFRQLLATPLIGVQHAIAALKAALTAQGFSPTVVRFVCVVASNRRLPALRGIVAAFQALVAAKRGVVTARVLSAHPLTEVQREQLRARLIEAGYGNVNMEEQVDPSLLGGLVVRIGARLYDSSIKSRLQRLQHAMKGAA